MLKDDRSEGVALYPSIQHEHSKNLGAAGHMLAASADLIDLLHLHPFLSRAGDIQFNVIFPRPGLYRVWTQFQRERVVNTVMFTIPVKDP
jgi:hypothetical protein